MRPAAETDPRHRHRRSRRLRPRDRHRDFRAQPGLEDYPLKKELEKQIDLPVFVENDCNIQALGVFEKELGGKPKSMVSVFLGTGIGAGIVWTANSSPGSTAPLARSATWSSTSADPSAVAATRSCFEALASRSAIFRMIEAAVKDGQKTLLTDMLGSGLDDMRSGDLRKAIRKGDKLVEKIVEEAAEYTGIAVANIINLLNPRSSSSAAA
jgi:glucokinase